MTYKVNFGEINYRIQVLQKRWYGDSYFLRGYW